MDNPFEFHEEDGIIACVGDNGGTTDDDIRNGFKRTVEILIKSLKVSQEVEDLLVYPIVYNYSFLLAEGVITVIIISIPAVARALAQVKKAAVE